MTSFQAAMGNTSKMTASSNENCKLTLPKLDYKNLAFIFLVYVALYSFLGGFFALMLKGVIATSSSRGGDDALLWTFFVVGMTFIAVVSLAVYVSQCQEKAKVDDGQEHQTRSRSSYLARMRRSFSGAKEEESEGKAEDVDTKKEPCDPSSHQAPFIDAQLKKLLHDRRLKVENEKQTDELQPLGLGV